MPNVSRMDVRNQLVQELDALTDEQLNFRINSNWTIGEVCDHLIKMDHQVLLTLQYTLTKNKEDEAPIKPIERALDRSIKIEAPDIVAPNPGPFFLKLPCLSGYSKKSSYLTKKWRLLNRIDLINNQQSILFLVVYLYNNGLTYGHITSNAILIKSGN